MGNYDSVFSVYSVVLQLPQLIEFQTFFRPGQRKRLHRKHANEGEKRQHHPFGHALDAVLHPERANQRRDGHFYRELVLGERPIPPLQDAFRQLGKFSGGQIAPFAGLKVFVQPEPRYLHTLEGENHEMRRAAHVSDLTLSAFFELKEQEMDIVFLISEHFHRHRTGHIPVGHGDGAAQNFRELQGRDPWKNENLLTLSCYFRDSLIWVVVGSGDAAPPF